MVMLSTKGAVGIRAERPIAGWLVFPALGTLISPFYSAYAAAQLIPILNQVLATNRDDLKTWLFAEILFNGILMVGWARALYLLWTRDARFPTNFVALCLIACIGVWADIAIGMQYAPTMDVAEESKAAIRTTIYAAVWVPYMLLSKRVKHTFGLAVYPQFGPGYIPQERAKPIKPSLPPERLMVRRRANRMGLFVTLVSAILLLLGLLLSAEGANRFSTFLAVSGFLGLLFGYLLVRAWYWVKEA